MTVARAPQHELSSGRLAFSLLRKPEELETIAPEWDRLFAQSGRNLFHRWIWMRMWFIARQRQLELYTLCARDERGTLVGILPLQRRWMEFESGRGWWAGFLGGDGSCQFLGVIARPESQVSVGRFLLESLRDHGEWDVLELSALQHTDPLIPLMHEVFESSAEIRELGRDAIIYRSFAPGETFDEFLRTTRRRENFLRRYKKLVREPGFELEIEREPERVHGHLLELGRLQRLRWQERARTARPEDAARLTAVGVELARAGLVTTFLLRLGGVGVAALLALTDQDFHYQMVAMDPAFGDRSVGLVLAGMSFRYALEKGFSGFSFGAGDEGYKLDWIPRSEDAITFAVARRSQSGAALIGAAASAT